MSDELKPCEDCKSNDLEVSWIETGFNKWWHVLCQECSNERNAATKAEAIAAWNARLATRPAPVGEPVAWMYESPLGRSFQGERHPGYVAMVAAGWTETPLYTRPALDVDGLVEKVARAIMEAKGGCEVKDWKVEARDNPHVALAVKQARAALAAIKDATDAG